MATTRMQSVQGTMMRVTRLDACGAPVYGPCSVVTTEGFVQVQWSEEIESGDEITQKNASGKLCINDSTDDITKYINLQIDMCDIDPDVEDIIGGATPVVHNGDTIGATYGPLGNTNAFAIEVWTKATGSSCAAGEIKSGYFCIPFVRKGRINGNITIANAALTMSFSGRGYAADGVWGIGPHGDNPMMAPTGIPAGDLWGRVTTSVLPPTPTEGCAALLTPADQSAVEPGDLFVSDAGVSAQDSTNAALLSGLGYVPADTAAWSAGEYFSIGSFRFSWDGSAWVSGEAT